MNWLTFIRTLSTRDIVLFGASTVTARTVEALMQLATVRCIADNDPAKWGSRLGGVLVVSPEQLSPSNGHTPFILVMTGDFDPVAAQLERRGFHPGNDFIRGRQVLGWLSRPIEPGVPTRLVDELCTPPSKFQKRVRFDIATAMKLEATRTSARFVTEQMPTAANLETRRRMLAYALDQRSAPGLAMEFGVFKGTSLKVIAQKTQGSVYGFDSFEGLPEDWSAAYRRGKFDLAGVVPDDLPGNVELVKGWFDDSLPRFFAGHPEPASFVHVDCDLYSSTRTVLEALTPRVQHGTVVLFDEYLNYPGWQQHEHKAFGEWIAQTGFGFTYLGYASSWCSVAVTLTR